MDLGNFFLLALIFLAIITRFIFIDRTAFFVNDQGRDMMVLFELVVNKKITLLGPATSFAAKYGNIYFGPYYYYFLAPFYLISQSAGFITMIFPILSIIGILLTLKLKELGRTKKIILLSLLGGSWYFLYYSRFIWNLNLAILLSLILFNLYLIFRAKFVKKLSYLYLFGLISGAVVQMHYGMIFLYAGLLITLKQKLKKMIYFIGIISSFFPFLVFDFRHQHTLSKNLLSFVSEPFKFAAIGNQSIPNILIKVFDFYLLPSVIIPEWFKITIIFFLYILLIKFLSDKSTELKKILFIIFLIFPLTFLVFKRDFDYYLACFAPWFYFGLGLFLHRICNGWLGKVCLSVAICSFMLINLYHYFTIPKNAYALYTQEKLAALIANYKKTRPEPDNYVKINVYPHQDDARSLLYILKTKHGIEQSYGEGLEFVVCYSQQCNSIVQDLKSSGFIRIYREANILELYSKK